MVPALDQARFEPDEAEGRSQALLEPEQSRVELDLEAAGWFDKFVDPATSSQHSSAIFALPAHPLHWQHSQFP